MHPALLGFVLASSLAGAPANLPLQDAEPPGAYLEGSSSPRLALPVTVRFDDAYGPDPTPLTQQQGGRAVSASRAPSAALVKYTLAVARRHFEDARWGESERGLRELVLRSVTVKFAPGPFYTAQVTVDRYHGGRRLGQATGTGMAQPDRSGQRVAAAFAGPFGAVVHHDANQPRAEEDAKVIASATLRALDSALQQLSAYWSNEQQAEALRQQHAPAPVAPAKGARRQKPAIP